MFEFVPAEKHATEFQRECLRRFWPDLYRYPGNRDVPADVQQSARRYREETLIAVDRDLRRRLGRRGIADAMSRCSIHGRFRFHLSNWSTKVARRCCWFLQPIMGMALRERERMPVWHATSDGTTRRSAAASDTAAELL